jgi:hypothetical protein
MILLLQQSPCAKPTADSRLARLEFQLTRYVAASEMDRAQRRGIFSAGKAKGARGPLRALITNLIFEHGIMDIDTLWNHLKKKAAASLNSKGESLGVQEIVEPDGSDEASMSYRSGNQEYEVTKRTVQNALYAIYTSNRYEPLNYLKKIFLKNPSTSFAAFWLAIQEECRDSAIRGFKNTRLLSARDHYLTYRWLDKEYRVSQDILWNRFRSFRRKNN